MSYICMILEKCIDLFLYFVFLDVILNVLTTVFKSEGPCIIANLSCVRRVFKIYFVLLYFFNANTF